MDSSGLVPPKVRVVLSSALIDVGTAATVIGSRLWETKPGPGSRAEMLLSGGGLSSSPMVDVVMALAAGTDNFHAFSRLLRLPEEFSPSLASLARSCIESLGRGWWLLEASNPAEMLHRAAALEHAEIIAGVKRGVTMVNLMPDGTFATVDDPIGDARRRLDAAGLVTGREQRRPGYAELAIAIMAAADVTSPAAEYSSLSGAAHGEATTISGHGVPRSGAESAIGNFKIGLTIRNARVILWTLVHVLDVFVSRLIADWEVIGERDRWVTSRERAFSTFQTVFDGMDEGARAL
ncbi:hypothetical protein BH11ACT4_BH11ACT4_06850 [soil metagenome]